MSFLEAVRTNNLVKVREEIAKSEVTQGILYTALVEASEKGYLEIVNFLIDAGVNVSIETYWGTPLGQAAWQGNLDVVRRLIEAGADVNYSVNIPENKTPLVLAVQEGHFDVIKVLIEAGANVNQGIKETDEFPILVAAANGNEELYNYLAPLTELELRLQAEKNLESGIRERKRQENANSLVKELYHAIFKNDLDKVKEIIARGIDVNSFDEYGCTPLLGAVFGRGLNGIAIVSLLLEAGANPNLGDDEGDETPLMRAMDKEICSLLIKAGANVNAQRGCGVTALIIATRYWGGREKMKLLIEAGANVNARDEDGKTALMYATEQTLNSLEKAELLIEAGADINARDNLGDTALSIAKKNGNNEVVQILIKAGATEE